MVDVLRGIGVGLLAAFVAVAPASAVTEGPANGARPMGMGGAFTAIADDANAPLYNPAGMAATDGIKMAFTRAAFFSGITDPLVSQDVAHVVFGAGANGFAAGVTSLADGGGVYRETVVSAGYARRIGDSLRLGLLLKRLGAGLDEANPDVAQNPYFADGTSVSAMSADVGALLSPTPGLTVGAAVQNVAPADMTFRPDDGEGAEDVDEASPAVRVGVAYDLSSVAGSAEQAALADILRRSVIAADVLIGSGTSGFGVGAEIGVSQSLAARVGYRTAAGYGESVGALTFGGSLGLNTGSGAVHIDFAADIAGGDLRDNMTQRVSLRGAF
jgi:hypothetical protein